MANQQPNQRFDPFAAAHGQFGNNPGFNPRQPKFDRLLSEKPNAKMEMDLNHEYLQGIDKSMNPAGGDFFMGAGFGNPNLGFDTNYLNYLPNNFGNGGQIGQNPYSGGNMGDTSNLFLTGNNPSNPNQNFLLQNGFGLGGLGGDPAGMSLYEGLVKNNPNEFWMQGGNQAFFGDKGYMNGANLGELENQLLLNGLDDITLKQDLNGVGNNFGMLGGANKMLQGLPISNQLGGLGNMQNPMLLNNLYGLGDQNLNMIIPGFEDLYQLQMQNSNNPNQLNSSQLNSGHPGHMNPGQLSKLNSNQFNLPSMSDAMLGKPQHNLMPNLKIENTLPSSGNFDGRALNDAHNLLAERNYAKMGGAGGNFGSHAANAGHNAAAGMNSNIHGLPGASAGQASMNQYMSNLNKNYPGVDLDGGNMQKYLPFLLNGGGGNIQEMLGGMDQRIASNTAQGNPSSSHNPTSGNPGGFNFQNNYNAALLNSDGGMNSGMMSDANQKQLGQFLTMNNLKSNPKPPGQPGLGSELDMMKLNSENWLTQQNSIKRDPMLYGAPNAESYSKWRERAKYERTLKIEKYKNKKRIWSKKISYDCRKRVADTRLRIKGRFISKKDSEKINLQGGKQEEGLNDKRGQNFDYIVEKFSTKSDETGNGLDAIANRSNISKKDLLKKIDVLLTNSNGAIDVKSLTTLQLPPNSQASHLLAALRQTENSKMVEAKIDEKLINKKKMFKILSKKIRRPKSSGIVSVPPKESVKGVTPSKNGTASSGKNELPNNQFLAQKLANEGGLNGHLNPAASKQIAQSGAREESQQRGTPSKNQGQSAAKPQRVSVKARRKRI